MWGGSWGRMDGGPEGLYGCRAGIRREVSETHVKAAGIQGQI